MKSNTRHLAALAALPLATAALLFLPGGTTAQDASAQGNAEKMPNPVMDTHDLMELFNEPLYERIKEAMGKELSDDKGWSSLEKDGNRLAEVANLVSLRNDDPEWKKWSADLQNQALQFAGAAEKKDLEATKKQWSSLVQSCNDCHKASDSDHAPILEP